MSALDNPDGRSSYQHPPFRNAYGSSVPMGWEGSNRGTSVQQVAERKSISFAEPVPKSFRFSLADRQSTGVQSEDMKLQQLQSLLDFALKQVFLYSFIRTIESFTSSLTCGGFADCRNWRKTALTRSKFGSWKRLYF